MKLTLHNIGKKYYREWIFRNVEKTFSHSSRTAIVGKNGSGKSTLLQVLSGAVIPNEGTIRIDDNERIIPEEDFFRNVSFASPYLELIEEFTLTELVRFHFKFKNFYAGLDKEKIIAATTLPDKSGQVIKYFSSGMKQRVKLALAILSDVKIILLDEPCSNLDSEGIEWFQKMISEYASDRTIIVASNHQEEEYFFCDEIIDMSSFKS